MPEKQAGPAPRVVRPRTRSIARVERLVIPSSLDISDSEEEHGQDCTSDFVPAPFGTFKLVAATNKVTGTARRRIPFTPRNINNYSSDRIVQYTRSTSAMTPASSSKKPRTTSTFPSQLNSPAPRNGSTNEDIDDSSVDGPPELIRRMMVICEQVTTLSVGKLEPALCEGGKRARHVDHRLPGRTCRGRRGNDQPTT
jgi:hypothetical protein